MIHLDQIISFLGEQQNINYYLTLQGKLDKTYWKSKERISLYVRLFHMIGIE